MASPLTDTHRRQQLALRAATVRDLIRLWPALDWKRLDETYPAFALSVGALVQRRRDMSSALAAAYVRAFRVAHGVPGELRVVFAEPVPAEALAVSLRTTAVAGQKTAAARGVEGQAASRAALVRTAGAVARHVLDGGRNTVRATLADDEQASGWRRVLTGRGCSFCSMLAGRGVVYSATTADFNSHDHCGCTAEPVYGE